MSVKKIKRITNPRVFKKLKIGMDKVEITFIDRIELDDIDEKSGEKTKLENEYTVKTKFKPHNYYINAVKKLAKFLGEICELEEAGDTITILGLEIIGSMEMKSARCVLYASKETKSLKKYKIKSPDIAMFTEEDYASAPALLLAVKLVISETLKYLEGKHLGDAQMALFDKR